jgi:hypothetical protein
MITPSPSLSFNNKPQKHWVSHAGLLHVDQRLRQGNTLKSDCFYLLKVFFN